MDWCRRTAISAPPPRCERRSRRTSKPMRCGAQQQQPAQKPFYLVGRLGDKDLSIAAEGTGLRVRMGNEQPQTINLQRREPMKRKPSQNRIRYPKESDQVSSDPAMAADEHRARSDRAAQMSSAAQRLVGREVGERGNLGDAGLTRDLLPAGEQGLGGNARGADTWGGEHRGRGWDTHGPAEDAGGEGEEARSRETAGRAALATDTAGGEARPGEDGPWEAPWDPQRDTEVAGLGKRALPSSTPTPPPESSGPLIPTKGGESGPKSGSAS